MGALSAFLRGVTGPGFSGLSQSMARQAEIEQARAQREADMAAEREWRSQEAEKNRVAREELQAARAAPGGGSSGSRRGALSDPEAAYDVRRMAALDGLMRQERMTRPEAEAIVNGAETGVNPLTKQTQTVEQIDDGDRQRNVTVNGSAPDVERFKSLVSQVGKYYAEAVSRAGSNFQQLKAGEQSEFETESGRRAQINPTQAGALGQGVAVSNSKPLFAQGDAKYTPDIGPLTKAKIGAEGALAAERGQKAISEKDKREGKGSIRDEIAVLEGDRKSLAVQLADTRAREALMAKDPTADAAEKAAIKARREVLERQANELENNRAELRRKLNSDKPAATDKPASASTQKMTQAQIQTALTQAKQVIASKPDQRDEVLRRLRAAGISTAGL